MVRAPESHEGTLLEGQILDQTDPAVVGVAQYSSKEVTSCTHSACYLVFVQFTGVPLHVTLSAIA